MPLDSKLLSIDSIADLYSSFTMILLDNLFSSSHTITVASTIDVLADKKVVNVYIASDKEWFAKIIGKNGQTINAIENLLKIKGYLNGYQVLVKIIK